MKYFILPILFILSQQISAQNWAPINSTEQFNYSLNNSDVITHAVKVDSVQVNGQDSVFHFNRIFAKCDTCFLWLDVLTEFFQEGGEFYHENQTNFMGNEVLRSNNNWFFELNDSTTCLLKPKASLLETWEFTPGQNAIVINESQENLFGVLDSTKLISVGNGNILKISKKHGIIEFPNFYGIAEYNLKGIQERDYGTALPDFESVFDFEVGDVFLYDFHTRTSIGCAGSPGYQKTVHVGIIKKTVEDVSISPSSISVTYSTVLNDTITESVYSSTSSENSVPQSTEVLYLAEYGSEQETYNIEEFLEVNPIPFGENNAGKFYEYDKMSDDRIIQYNGGYEFVGNAIERNFFHYNFYHDPDSDSEGYIWIYSNSNLNSDISDWLELENGILGHSRKAHSNSNGLGKISNYRSSSFPGQDSTESPASSNFENTHLIAFVKMNGDSGGVMLTDEEVLGVAEFKSNSELSIYPNPTTNQLTISSDSRMEKITIFNSLGEEIKRVRTDGLNHSFDLHNLSNGIYLAQVWFENGTTVQRRIVKS